MKAFRFLVLLFTAIHCEAADRRPEYTIRFTDTAPVIDGDLSDPAWATASEMELRFFWPKQTGDQQRTRVKLLWDDKHIYAAFTVADRDITAIHENRDDPTYEDDAVELFLNPFPNRSSYVGLEINARAVLYDYLHVHGEKLYANYDLKNVKLAHSLQGTLNRSDDVDEGWTIELAIPLSNLIDKWDRADVRDGTVWTINASRWDGREPDRMFSIWSNSGLGHPDPHAPGMFGALIFAR
ncbi:MAG TPA: carbohydrate-binding family 9-like protein [Candidatus Synoicihabitans sp.]|nr:carbohydrate-binding family 9-like protein [Candidatus Synoicihabitans sp.]